MKFKLSLLISIQLICINSFSQWNNNPAINTPVSIQTNDQQDPRIIADGKNGAIIAWVDYRNNIAAADIFVQRMNSAGYRLWASNGVAICTSIGHQNAVTIASSDNQSAILTWQDSRSGNKNIYAQKIDSLGNVLWTANGIGVCIKALDQRSPKIISDQLGGAIIVWEDSAGGFWDLYAQHINSSGIATWTAGGVIISNAADSQINPKIISDNSNGAIIAWQDRRNLSEYNIFAQRINAVGAIQWTANGIEVCSVFGGETNPKLAMDGTGGAYIAWQDRRSGSNYDIFAQRVNASGALQWATIGVSVCSATGSQSAIDITTDMVAGIIVSWKDDRSGIYQVYANMLSPAGVLQWATNGVLVAPGINPNIVGDTNGGAILVW